MFLTGLAVAEGAPKSSKAAQTTKTAKTAPQGPQVPPPEVLLILIRSALIGLDHANRTGNYSVLREMGGPALQQYSSGQLSNAFAPLRSNKVDLLPAAILTPQLLQQPAVSPTGVLRLVGYVPAKPRRIEFQIFYQVARGQWRLAGLNVGLGKPPQAKAQPRSSESNRKPAEKSGQGPELSGSIGR